MAPQLSSEWVQKHLCMASEGSGGGPKRRGGTRMQCWSEGTHSCTHNADTKEKWIHRFTAKQTPKRKNKEIRDTRPYIDALGDNGSHGFEKHQRILMTHL